MPIAPGPHGPGPRWAHVAAWLVLAGVAIAMIAAVVMYQGRGECPCGIAVCPPWPECDLLEGADSALVMDPARARR